MPPPSRSRLGRQLTRAALGLAAFALASSVLATPRPVRVARAEPSAARTEVVLVTLDGSRYREIFEGTDGELAKRHGLPEARWQTAELLTPNLHRLIEAGAALGAPQTGEAISASGPNFVSLPGYSEIFTGRRVTGCSNNDCRGTLSQSIADAVADAPKACSSAVVTSWPDIARVAARSERVAVSAGRHAGDTRWRFEGGGAVGSALRRAESQSPWPGHGDFRRDRFTAELAVALLAADAPSFLFVGFGETDEFGHLDDYAGYLDALHEADQHIGELWAVLERHRAEGVRTALLVTADHGRGSGFRDHGLPYPESARVWLVAAGSEIPARGRVASPVARRLADIAPTLRLLFGLPADTHENAGKPLLELFAAARD